MPLRHRSVLVALLLAAALPAAAQQAAERSSELALHAYTLRSRSADEAADLVRGMLSDRGTVTVQADGTTKYYLLTLDSGGNALITQGSATDLPAAPAGECPVGYLKIVADGGAFTPATTDHDDANVTTTYVNLSQLPLALS